MCQLPQLFKGMQLNFQLSALINH